MRYILLLPLLFSFNVYSQAFICTAESGAGVENVGATSFSAKVYDVSDEKFVLSKPERKWVLKMHGQHLPRFENCVSEFYCSDDDGFSGVFFRSTEGHFTYITIRSSEKSPEKQEIVTMKGRCSEI